MTITCVLQWSVVARRVVPRRGGEVDRRRTWFRVVWFRGVQQDNATGDYGIDVRGDMCASYPVCRPRRRPASMTTTCVVRREGCRALCCTTRRTLTSRTTTCVVRWEGFRVACSTMKRWACRTTTCVMWWECFYVARWLRKTRVVDGVASMEKPEHVGSLVAQQRHE